MRRAKAGQTDESVCGKPGRSRHVRKTKLGGRQVVTAANPSLAYRALTQSTVSFHCSSSILVYSPEAYSVNGNCSCGRTGYFFASRQQV